MGMTDQVVREAEAPVTSELDEVGALVDRVRAGELSEDAAFEAIGRIVRRRAADAGDIYQKPWG